MECLKLTYKPIFEPRTHGSIPSREAKVVQMFISVDPLAEQFVGWSPYSYTFNNLINWIDPTGMAPEDWIKNMETGEVRWFDGTAQEAEQKAKEHWRTSISETPEVENLGKSYFGTKSKYALDNIQMNEQRESYLMEVSKRLGEEAGVTGQSVSITRSGVGGDTAVSLTFNSLKSYFMGDGNTKKESGGMNSELAGLIWGYGGSDVVQKRLPKNLFTKTAFRGLDIYFNSESLGVGSDKGYYEKMNANYEFKTKVLKVLTKETLMKIGMKKY